MQQLGRRAGALNVDLISNRPEVMTLLPSSAQRLDERDVAMFESRAKWVDLISLLSTCIGEGGSEGENSLLWCVVLVWDVGAAGVRLL